MASLLRRLLPTRIPNTSSQQRDHHANERTFLSWTRAGLGFAAMALALDRLDKIDRVLSSKLNLGAILSPQAQTQVQESPSQQPESPHSTNKDKTLTKDGPNVPSKMLQSGNTTTAMLSNTFSASRLCQLLGLWSLGYGFFRYWSMRRYLLQGQFVPAFWGPVFMTVGSFGAFMMLGLQMERRQGHRE